MSARPGRLGGTTPGVQENAPMTIRRLTAICPIVAPMLLMIGCQGNEAERAVKDVAGVEEGTNTRTADVEEQTYIVEEVDRIIEADTGKVVGEQVDQTEVTVQKEVKVEREVDVESGDTSTQTKGYVPDDLDDN
jgi:hypothetical protein